MNICEHFYSLQGEGKHIGIPSYFIRVSGCPLRCKFCDSKFAWNVGANDIKIENELDMRKFYTDNIYGRDVRHIVFTGGEPLYKDNYKTLFEFIKFLTKCNTFIKSYKFTIETTGIVDPNEIAGNNIIDVLLNLNNVFNPQETKENNLSDITLSISPKFNMCAYEDYPDVTKKDLYNYYSLKGMSLKNYSFENVYYKFVHTNYSGPDISDFVENHILETFKDNIFVMPLTNIPYNEIEYNDNCKKVANFCKENCLRYSPRLHVDLWGLMKGV